MSDSVAIICGGGDFPTVAARAAQAAGKPIFLLGLRGIASADIEQFPHIWLSLGELGRAFRELHARKIRKAIFIGGLGRPEFADLRLDWGAVRRLPQIVRLLRGGDDHALTGVINLFEQEGITIIGVDALVPDLLSPAGVLVGKEPNVEARADLDVGWRCLSALSPFDVGQSLVVYNRRIIAIEAAEGTDAMLTRVVDLRESGRWRARDRAGFLIKGPKQGQDLRIDLPAMGDQTIEIAHKARLAGVMVKAGGVLMLNRPQLVQQAQAAGLSLFGF